ncbi:ABC transporter substrate-binding protein [Nocardioides gansuensis]|uniref:ABC transporter substrate-binding protein n=1 Tax=Nocardioides gansuensis TaxID=2138300 RepID=A0A2T8F8C0_9ACTN|nr:transporter substrate-binding domain-containing protein [Nocardioides gansuensis]PVG81964.1 ABC transporter substrate-binding protein [Nocardioides gansuensis]
MPKPRAFRAAAVLVVALAASACGAADAEDKTSPKAAPAPEVVADGVLTVCTSLPYRPFEFRQEGEVVGFDIDLAREVASRLDLEAKFVNTDFDGLAAGTPLNDGTCDVGVAGMTITGDRARVLDFTSPYFNAAQSLVVGASSGVTSLDELSGRKIAVQEGTTAELYVTDNAPADAEIVTVEKPFEIVAALRDGQVAAGVYDNTVVGGVVERNPEIAVAAEFDTGEQYGMVLKKDGSVELVRSINAILADLRSDGGYDAIYEKWFGSAPAS